MFHTLSELQEKEKNKDKPAPKKSISTMSKQKSPEDNYYGKSKKQDTKKRQQIQHASFKNRRIGFLLQRRKNKLIQPSEQKI